MADRPNVESAAVREALSAAVERLLAERADGGHWVGELSSSSLSTATAAFALARADAVANTRFIRRGLEWVDRHQNNDGGWGDTVRSRSNLATTALCWSALVVSPYRRVEHEPVIDAAAKYLCGQAGSLAPADLARAVARRYGRDRSFSAPILTLCALAGRLGEGRAAWRYVAQLPFELAACPHGMLKALRLPVVSYALPALIAVGQVRHHCRPTWNPLARAVRGLTRDATLAVLEEIQPASGGFLEAAPLTSFVLMSLAAMGPGCASSSAVTRRAARFLQRTVRPDGSWPIDTNLATWVTTQAVDALPAGALDAAAREAIRGWLLNQQHGIEHPYTRAEPGGWAWTDLSGGVPDTDDTAGALRALRRLGPPEAPTRRAARAACKWLLDLQNADGGFPTFCKGWGHLPFDRSSHDLTAHALLALSTWAGELPDALRKRLGPAVRRAVEFLTRCQGPDGEWTPLWFGNEDAPAEANPVYGTARVLAALTELLDRTPGRIEPAASKAAAYLLSARGEDGAWGGAAGVAPSIEETAVAVAALSGLVKPPAADVLDVPAESIRSAVAAGAAWLIERTAGGTDFPAAPIGLYFAKLWYFEKLYPIIFTVSALRRAAEALDL